MTLQPSWLEDLLGSVTLLKPDGVALPKRGKVQFTGSVGVTDDAVTGIATVNITATGGGAIVDATATPYSAVGNGIADDAAAIAAANAAAVAGAGRAYLRPGTFRFGSNTPLATLEPATGAAVKPDSGITVTLSKKPIAPDDQQIFNITGGGNVVLPAGVTQAAWFGLDASGTTDCLTALTKALAATPVGSVVVLQPGQYRVNGKLDVAGRVLRGTGKGVTRLFLGTADTHLLRCTADDSVVEDLILDGNFLASSAVVGLAGVNRSRFARTKVRKSANASGSLVTISGTVDAVDFEDFELIQDPSVTTNRSNALLNVSSAATRVRLRRGKMQGAAYGVYLSGGGVVLDEVDMGNFTALGVLLTNIAVGGVVLRRVKGTQAETVALFHMQSGASVSRELVTVEDCVWQGTGNPLFLTCQHPTRVVGNHFSSTTGITVTPTAGLDDNWIYSALNTFGASIPYRNADGTQYAGSNLVRVAE